MIIDNAVILAGGKGSRAKIAKNREWMPKVLFKIGSKTILQRNLEILRDHLGVKLVWIIIGEKDSSIQDKFKDGKDLGLELRYIQTDPTIGIADALYAARDKVNGSFLFMLADEFYLDSNHGRMLTDQYLGADAVVTFIHTDNPQDIAKNYSIHLNGSGQVSSLTEKPSSFDNNLLGLGTMVLTETVFDYIEKTEINPRTQKKELIDTISLLAKEGKVYAHELQGSYVNINTVKDWYRAKDLLNQRNFDLCKKSLVIPTLNEIDSIGFVLDDFRGLVDEIIIADGGSTDGTIEKILDLEDRNDIKLIRGDFVGYGDALRHGLEAVTGDIVTLVEADATFRSRDLYKMYEYIKDCEMVIGTRTTKELISQGANMRFAHRYGNMLVAKILALLWWRSGKPNLTDVGCTYRVFWISEYNEIKHNFTGMGPEFSPEMIVEFLRNDKRIIEIPISYYKRMGGSSKHGKDLMGLIKTGWKMLSLIITKKFTVPRKA